MKSGGRPSKKKGKNISTSKTRRKLSARKTVSKELQRGKSGKVLLSLSAVHGSEILVGNKGNLSKKIGGVKITMRRVDSSPVARQRTNAIPTGKCPCGKSNAECADWWDKFLGITSHAGDSGGGIKSQYYWNVQKIRRAIADGHDPYHFRMLLGGKPRSDWTPYMPPGSFVVPITTGAKDAKRKASGRINGGNSGCGDGRSAGGSGGERSKRRSGSKSV